MAESGADESTAPPSIKPHRWQKGQSGNPKGRPKGQAISLLTIMQRRLRANPELGEELVDELFNLARKGDAVGLKAVQEVISRIDGGIVKHHKVTGDVSMSKLVSLEGDEGDPEAGEDEGGDGGGGSDDAGEI